jgi:hypothetical protein
MEFPMIWLIIISGIPIAILSTYFINGLNNVTSLTLLLFTEAGFPIVWIVGNSTNHASLAWIIYIVLIAFGTLLNHRKV